MCILALGFCLASATALAQAPSATQLIEQRILALDFPQAEAAIADLADPAQQIFYRHHLAFVRALASQDSLQLAAFEGRSEAWEDELIPRKDPANVAYRAELYFERAIIKVMQQRQFAAFWDVRRAYQLAESLQKDYPNAGYHYRLLGVFHLALSAMPDQYKWVAGLLGYEGDYDTGVRYVQLAIQQDVPLALEARVYRYFIAKHLDANGAQALSIIQGLHQQLPESPLLAFLYAGHLFERKQGDAAGVVLAATEARLSPSQKAAFAYYHYAWGRLHLYREDYAGAGASFRQFLAIHKGRLLRQDARFRSAMCYLLSGNSTSARTELVRVSKESGSGFDDDMYAGHQAAWLLQKGWQPADLSLFRARYRYDGGYLKESAQLLAAVQAQPAISPDQTCELHYRKARLAQAQGQPAEARRLYLLASQAPASTQPNQRWMAAYSLYYLGTLAEDTGQLTQALAYLEATLVRSGYDYQLGLEQKVKAARVRVKRKLKAAKP